MPTGLQIPYRRERWLVGAADVLTLPLRLRPRPRGGVPSRILLLRLERIGDLLMVVDAIAALRAALPDAAIDLAVGSWNRDLAALIPGIRTLHVLDVPWLARDGGGDSAATLVAPRPRAGADSTISSSTSSPTSGATCSRGSAARPGASATGRAAAARFSPTGSRTNRASTSPTTPRDSSPRCWSGRTSRQSHSRRPHRHDCGRRRRRWRARRRSSRQAQGPRPRAEVRTDGAADWRARQRRA